MLSIRLSRSGKKKQPHYRIIVIDKARDPWGKALEIIGSRNPRSKEMTLKEDRVKYWIEKGAQPSNSVWNLLVEAGIVQGEKRGVTHLSKKRRAKTAEAEAEAKAKEEEAKAKATEAAAAEKAAAEAPAPAEEAKPEETPAEPTAETEVKSEEKPAEEEKKEEAPAEEPKEE